MTACLTFRPAVEYPPGAIWEVLSQCYADILDTAMTGRLQQFDREAYENPETAGACTFITSVAGETVGLASYDPRRWPSAGVVGHNGIVPPWRRRGYGTQQIFEILRRFRQRRFEKARVSTSEHPFFAPARKMYEACGFSLPETNRRRNDWGCRMLDYELTL